METWRQEYKSTLTDQTVDFWNANVGENDIIIYNWEINRICYTYYFPEEKLFFVQDVDLTQDFGTAWFIFSANEWDFSDIQKEIFDLQIIYQGHFGIEYNISDDEVRSLTIVSKNSVSKEEYLAFGRVFLFYQSCQADNRRARARKPLQD